MQRNHISRIVVICFKISIFAVAETTHLRGFHDETQVVICFKISIFAVAETTDEYDAIIEHML